MFVVVAIVVAVTATNSSSMIIIASMLRRLEGSVDSNGVVLGASYRSDSSVSWINFEETPARGISSTPVH